MKRANLEIIAPTQGSSFFMTHHKAPFFCHGDYWHFHPEFEIVYVPVGNGKRFVGQKASRYTNGDLVLLGPGILHNTFNFGFESPASTYEEYVVQFKEDQIEKITDHFPEFARIIQLLRRARTGMAITGEAKHRIGALLGEMTDMASFQRLMQLFQVLREMSQLSPAEVIDLEARQSLERTASVFSMCTR
jgi:mannose-6-phosphate isomerase-like protein (cupin superfamily)